MNLLDEPVDVYVRTSGFVEAFSIQEDLAPGEVSNVAAPPADGVFLVTLAGAGDPTCVVGCDHFISETTAFQTEGPFHTVVLYDDEFDSPRAFDLWELPTPDTMVAANAMVPADPTTGLAVVTAVAATGIDFGVRLATDAAEGCLEPVNVEGILIGGNQTPAFDVGAATTITLHDQPDRDCSGDPVGGPFEVDAGPGERLHVFLTGEPGSMDAVILPMLDDPAAPPVADITDDTADGAAVDTADDVPSVAVAVDLMTDEVAGEFGLDDATARCTAELLVDALGADVIVVDGSLVDLDGLSDEFIEPAGQALVAAVDECGLDPAVFGG
ncbi:MAG: hypothetical protein ACE37B_09330 [Ilumatobacter sp.]|uniref:hypothetical protein n=1 Tax=Ilumatobacter sp. TaxID=1967498 RepID=UPI00391955F0